MQVAADGAYYHSDETRFKGANNFRSRPHCDVRHRAGWHLVFDAEQRALAPVYHAILCHSALHVVSFQRYYPHLEMTPGV